MDPITDLPPMTTHLADPPPALPTNHAHPSYPEMITEAIAALKDKDGSSKQAISKYIEKEYTNLPQNHSVLLTYHLKSLRNQGQLVMVKYSYMFPPPRSDQFQPPSSTDYQSTFDYTGAVDATDVNPSPAGVNLEINPPSGSLKRKPGRPPKNRSDSGVAPGVQAQMQNVQGHDVNVDVPPYQPQFQSDAGVGQDLPVNHGSGSEFQLQGNNNNATEPLFASLGLGDEGVVAAPSHPPTVAKKGRGRPPKVKRGVGRPKRIGLGPVAVPLSGNAVATRRRPKRAGPGRPHVSRFGRLTGKPVGKPSKGGAGTAVIVTDPRQLVVYQELKNKYELLQSKVKQLAVVVKPCINPHYGTVALQALQELEALAEAGTTNGPLQEPEPEPIKALFGS